MSGIQMGGFMALGQKFDFSKATSLVDIGGSAGLLSLMVARHQPHMSCVTWIYLQLDPLLMKQFKNSNYKTGLKSPMVISLKTNFPKADIITMGNILHDWDEETKLMLMKKAYDALPEGGAFIAIESIIDDDRKQNVFGMMMSINMLIETGTGFDYTLADFSKWARQVGFKSTALLPLAGAYKRCDSI